jgi:transcriptional regulator with GAF, ATPase, and Fis domain
VTIASPAFAGEDHMDQTDLSHNLLEAMRDLEDLLPLQDTLTATLDKIAEASVRLIDGCDLASVTVIESGDARTRGSSDQVAIDLDLVQYEAGSGPCLQAITEGRTIQAADLETDQNWPDFADAAFGEGLNSSLSIPIEITDVKAGLNLYGREKNGFDPTSPYITELLTSRASLAIQNAQIHGASKRLIEQLHEAIKTREIIGEAKGILMAREGVSEDEAFQMLVTASQSTNTKLKDVAQTLVDKVSPLTDN